MCSSRALDAAVNSATCSRGLIHVTTGFGRVRVTPVNMIAATINLFVTAVVVETQQYLMPSTTCSSAHTHCSVLVSRLYKRLAPWVTPVLQACSSKTVVGLPRVRARANSSLIGQRRASYITVHTLAGAQFVWLYALFVWCCCTLCVSLLHPFQHFYLADASHGLHTAQSSPPSIHW